MSNTIPMSDDDVLCIYLRKLVSNTIPMSDDVLCIYLRILVKHDSCWTPYTPTRFLC